MQLKLATCEQFRKESASETSMHVSNQVPEGILCGTVFLDNLEPIRMFRHCDQPATVLLLHEFSTDKA